MRKKNKRYVKLKGRRQSKEITARQSMGMERTVSYSEMVRSNERGSGDHFYTS